MDRTTRFVWSGTGAARGNVMGMARTKDDRRECPWLGRLSLKYHCHDQRDHDLEVRPLRNGNGNDGKHEVNNQHNNAAMAHNTTTQPIPV